MFMKATYRSWRQILDHEFDLPAMDELARLIEDLKDTHAGKVYVALKKIHPLIPLVQDEENLRN